MKAYLIIFAGLNLLACSPEFLVVDQRSVPLMDDATQTSTTGLEASVSSYQGEFGLIGAASVTNFEIEINCTYGSANIPVVRLFTKLQFDTNAAKLPIAAKNCSSYLKSLSVAVPTAPTKNWNLRAPGGTNASSFANGSVLTYDYSVPPNLGANDAQSPAQAKLKRAVELPASIAVDPSKNKIEFSFTLSTESTIATSAYTVNAQTVESSASVSGLTPPLYAITVASAAANNRSCSLLFRAVCDRPQSINNQLDSCNDVTRANTLVTIDGTTIPTGNITLDPTTPATAVRFPYTIDNCDPGVTGFFTKTLQAKFVDNTDPNSTNKATLTTPITLNLTFSPN